MLKPLAEKTINKRFESLGLSKEIIDLLHTYFLCFSNLYGAISLWEAWDIFREYEGLIIHKKDFVSFSDIEMRREGNPFSIYEIKEVYIDETTDDPLERLIVNNKLIGYDINKFDLIYELFENFRVMYYYSPINKEFLSFTQDRFYLTNWGLKMKSFVEGLKTSGISRDFEGKPNGEILDIDGNPVKGKKLSEFTFYTIYEKYEIDYYESQIKKDKLKKRFCNTAAEKVLDYIETSTMTGFLVKLGADEFKRIIEFTEDEIGVRLNDKEINTFLELLMNLNNKSNLWINKGWKPEEL